LGSIHLQRVRQFSLLKPVAVRDFRLLWLGQGVSLFGDQFYLVALPWLTLQLTGSALALGSVLMVAGGARALFQLLGGALSDRFSMRTLMLVSNIVRAIVTAAITVVVLAGITRLWHLYVLSLVFGLVDAFFLPAYMSIVPKLVVTEYLAASNALLRGTARFMALIGPVTAGVIISTHSLGMAFAIDTATFVFAAALIWLMKKRPPISPDPEELTGNEKAGRLSLFQSIKEGLVYAWRHPLIRALLFFIAAIEFSFVGPSSVGLPALARQRFGFEQGATSLGWLMSSFGGGMLAGMLIAGSIKVARRQGRVVIGVTFAFGLGLALVGFSTHLVWACATLAFIGLGGGLANIVILALVQAKTDKRMLGRVMGLMMFGMSLLEPLSFALAGAMADKNITMLFAASGAIILATALLSLGSSALRSTD
jgi:MFS family permease